MRVIRFDATDATDEFDDEDEDTPVNAARERDDTGRPRNARPRDAYGRPLPRAAQGEERVPEDLEYEPADGLVEAQQLLDADRPFHAHEVLEAVWKSVESDERDLWQGLAQLAVGLTHVRRGNPKGAASLLSRGAERIAPYGAHGAAPHGIDVDGLVRRAYGLAERITAEGLEAVPESELALRLTARPGQPGHDG